jgi:hypothetical protein
MSPLMALIRKQPDCTKTQQRGICGRPECAGGGNVKHADQKRDNDEGHVAVRIHEPPP